MESLESRRERSVEMRDQDDSHVREKWEGGYDDFEENCTEKSRDTGKHRSKERSKSSRREEKDHRSRDRERSKASDVTKERERASKDLEKDRATTKDGRSRDDQNKDRTKDKRREKDYDWDKYKDKERDKDKDKDRKDRGKERDRDRETEATDKDNERAREKERSKEKGKDRDKERDRAKDKEREKERDKNKDRDREREIDNDRDRDVLETEKGKERIREERESGQDKERSRERDKVGRKHRGEGHDRGKYATKDDTVKLDREDGLDGDITTWGKGSHHEKDDIRSTKYQQSVEGGESRGSHASALELEERISKMKEERMRNKSEGLPEILAWVNKSRKLEERRSSEKEKALQLSKIFEEKDNINQGEIENEAAPQHIAQDLAGVKVLHGLDKVIECGAVVLTLKDHSILAGGDINQEVDMLENVEIGEQKRRNEAYSSAKKKTGIYDDKFNDEPGSEKKILQKYDDPVVEEGITLDASGRFTGDAEKKLEELRRRIQGVSTNNHFEDLNSSDQIKSDYYTHEERLQFKKPKKKKSLRKKEKLDINALEVEAVSAGLGVGDLGSRKYEKRQAIREEKERSEAEKRSNAHQAAYAKADEASKALRLEQTIIVKTEEDDNPVFGDDDEDLRKSLERARKFALKKQDEASTSGPQAIAFLASSTVRSYTDSGAGVGYGSLSVPFLIYQFFGERLATSEERLAMTEQRLATSNPTTKACDLRLPLVDCKFLYPSSFSSPLMSAVSEKIMPNPTHISHPHPCRVVSTRVLCPKPASPCSNSTADDQNPASGETQENKVVFTEMEEFVWGLQLDEEAHKPDGEDVFMEEDVAPIASDQEMKDEDGGWTEVNDTDKEEPTAYEDKEEIVPDEMIHEAAVGKGLSGALKLLKERGSLKETVERGGRNMDKKKSKLVGIYDTDRQKEIRIERTDEFGRILTPKEAFRLISHKFHGKGPGKTKQEKRIRQYQEELKVKQMMPSDTPSLSVERMREAQARLKTPYLVLSGHVKPGQTSDPRSGFATVEKDLPGGLTPMLGDRKVEHFLGIKRKAEPGDMGPPKKPKT